MPRSKEFDPKVVRIIRYWYLYKDLPLLSKDGKQGVLELMKERHEFEASKAQYTKLFQEQGWSKNFTEKEHQAISINIARKRKSCGRDDTYDLYDQGRLVPRKKVQKDLQRYSATTGDIFNLNVDDQLPLRTELRLALKAPIKNLIFEKLPILQFRPISSDLGRTNNSKSLDSRSASKLSFSNDFKLDVRNQISLDSLLPTQNLAQEPNAAHVSLQITDRLKSSRLEALQVFLLSNGLPSDANGTSIYLWLKDQRHKKVIITRLSCMGNTAMAMLEALFREAIMAGNYEIVTYLLKAGVNPNGHKLKLNIEMRPGLKPCLPIITTSLEYACLYGLLDIILVLLQHGAMVGEGKIGNTNSLLTLAIIGYHEGILGFVANFLCLNDIVDLYGLCEKTRNYGTTIQQNPEGVLCSIFVELLGKGANINPYPNSLTLSPISAAKLYGLARLNILLREHEVIEVPEELDSACICDWETPCNHQPKYSFMSATRRHSNRSAEFIDHRWCFACLARRQRYLCFQISRYSRVKRFSQAPLNEVKLLDCHHYRTCLICEGIPIVDLAVALKSMQFVRWALNVGAPSTAAAIGLVLKYKTLESVDYYDIFTVLLKFGVLKISNDCLHQMLQHHEYFSLWFVVLLNKVTNYHLDMDMALSGLSRQNRDNLMKLIFIFSPVGGEFSVGPLQCSNDHLFRTFFTDVWLKRALQLSHEHNDFNLNHKVIWEIDYAPHNTLDFPCQQVIKPSTIQKSFDETIDDGDLNAFRSLLSQGINLRPCHYPRMFHSWNFIRALILDLLSITCRDWTVIIVRNILYDIEDKNNNEHLVLRKLIAENSVRLHTPRDSMTLLGFVIGNNHRSRIVDDLILQILLDSSLDVNLACRYFDDVELFNVISVDSQHGTVSFANALPLQVVAGNNHKEGNTLLLLLRAGANPDLVLPGLSLTTLQILLLLRRSDTIIRAILDSKADLEKRTLCCTVFRRNAPTTSYQLLEWCGVDTNVVIKQCTNTPLQIASQTDRIDNVGLLLEYGADVNAPPADHGGATALQYAAMYGYLGIVVLLLDNGADVNAAPALYDGKTALEAAAEYGRLDMAQLLINAGAKFTLRCFDLASTNGHHTLRKLLEEQFKARPFQIDSTYEFCDTQASFHPDQLQGSVLDESHEQIWGDALKVLGNTLIPSSRLKHVIH